MNKKTLILASILIAVTALPVLAGPTAKYLGIGKRGTYSGFPGVTVYAGELRFEANGIAGVQDGNFISFCIEANEEIHQKTYNAVLNTEAVHGGIGGPSPDPLNNSTAWLYNHYLDNVLAASTNTLAKDYQMAIWYLEEEISDINHLSGNAQNLVSIANTNGANWINNTIRVLNLYDSNGAHAQDTMVRIAPVPTPSAVLLGSMGMGLVGWLRRRRSL